GWAELDDAHNQQEDRDEAREAAREAFIESLMDELKSIGQAHGKNARRLFKVDEQFRDSAMESALDSIFGNAKESESFSIALVQIWADQGGEYQLGDTPIDRLVNVINSALLEFAGKKAKAEIR
ncbi:MAG: hypothetical protein H6R24_2314, partial [Proteobacteria bacterium]|nr:hypothetical protein [Pseudomonadota bacterium]